jgi:hypothetical protein
MKANKFFSLAAIVCGAALSFNSCSSNNDNPIVENEKQTATISFEGKTLNADGYWCGDESGVKYDNWGSDAYACTYKEGPATFPVNWTPAWGSWTGFAISNRTETTYNAATMTPDQFNNITGGARSGNNFMVLYPFGESITFDKPVTIKGFWFTNDAWTVDAILNGDGMSPGKFEADDYLTCIMYPDNGMVSGARIEIPLASDGQYVNDWVYCDLSDTDVCKNVSSLSFSFEGSKANDYGLTTPTYICIDDIEIEY